MRSRSLFAGMILSLAAIGVASSETLIPSVPNDTVITIQRGACERRCAVYKVVIFADGVTLFDGEHFVRHTGLARYKISIDLIGRFLEHATQAGFFEMRDSYAPEKVPRCSHLIDDAPIVVVTIAAGGLAKAVVHNHRCLDPDSSKLTLLEKEIDSMAAVSQRVR